MFLLLLPMNTSTWHKSFFLEMEKSQILLKLAGAACHRESFQSENEIKRPSVGRVKSRVDQSTPDLFLMRINPDCTPNYGA